MRCLLSVMILQIGVLSAQQSISDHSFNQYLPAALLNEEPPEVAGAPSFCPCTITQGAYSAPLPFFSNGQSAVSFYSYGVPLGACANTGFEQSEHLILMLYEDINTGEVSFVFIADEANDPTGGTMDVTVSCLPNTATIDLEDDPGEFMGSPPTFTGKFIWSNCCTDGGIVGGLGCGTSFTFDMDNLSGVDVVTLLYGSPANPIWVNLPSSECPFIINCGGQVCCDNVLSLEAEIQNANCSVTADGMIDLEVTAECIQTQEYLWSNGETTEDISDLEPGDYSVTVTEPNGCSEVETFTVGVEFMDPQPVISGPTWYCEGEVVELSVSGNYITYDWSTGESTPDIFISDPGIYWVTVTNEGGCIGTDSISIEEYPAPVPVITGPTEICPGATIQLEASPGYTLYEWSNGAYTQIITVSDPGSYTVLVTDHFGCTGEATWDVMELPAPEPVISGPTSICAGQTIILEVDDIFETYLWSTGATIPQIEVTAPGVYTITVTNNEACPGIAVWEVKESFAVPLLITGDTLTCPGDSALLTAPPIYLQYQWSTMEITPSIQVLGPGTFELIVVDDFGCRDTADFTVGLLPPINPQISGNTVICLNDTTLLTPGTGYTSYLWSTGSQAVSIPVSSPGMIAVEVVDTNGCIGADTVIIVVNSADTTHLFTSSCHPQDTGLFKTLLVNQFGCDSITLLTVSFELADTTLVAATSCDPQDEGIQIEVLTSQFGCDSVVITSTALLPSDTTMVQATTCDPSLAGLSILSLMNQWGCDSLVRTQTTFVPADTLVIKSSTCDPQVADTTATVLSNQFGCDSVIIQQIRLLPSSAKTLILFSCNPLDTGTITQTFSNQFGCDSTVTWKTQLVPLDSCILRVISTMIPGPCSGDEGQIRLDADLGSFPVTVTWTMQGSGSPQSGTWANFFSPFLISNLTAGTYFLDLIDKDGHSWADTVTITGPEPLVVDLVTGPVTNGYAIACFGDQTGSLSVAYLSGGSPPISAAWSTGQSGTDLMDLPAGTYTVTVTDDHGCTEVLSQILNEPPPFHADWTFFQDPCDGLPAEVVNSTVSGGISPIVWSLDGVSQPGQDWPPLPSGSVALSATDANGCYSDTLVEIQPESIFSVELGPNQLHEENKLIFLLAEIFPDSAAIQSIEWSPELCKNCLNPAFRVKETTTITVTVTSLGGCISTDAVLIELDRRDIYIPNSFSPNNDGLNDLFAPQGDPVVEVLEFAVYDRWGDEVFRHGGFYLGDPDIGWNGDVRGQEASIDVYVYVMILRWPDGQERLYKGDLQLMR